MHAVDATHTRPHGPRFAEMVHSACRRAGDATLAFDSPVPGTGDCPPVPAGVIHLYDEQAFIVTPDFCHAALAAQESADPEIGRSGIPAMVEVADVAPVELREPVRALIWLRGSLHSVPAELQRELALEIATEHPHDGLLDLGHGYSLVRLNLSSVVVAGRGGASLVTPTELAAAGPDPFWSYETDWLAHLDADHADLVGELARRLPEETRTGRVRPLGLDRGGIDLRIEGPAGDSDARLEFPRPVNDVVELSQALRLLTHR